jgi:hypothetical protein
MDHSSYSYRGDNSRESSSALMQEKEQAQELVKQQARGAMGACHNCTTPPAHWAISQCRRLHARLGVELELHAAAAAKLGGGPAPRRKQQVLGSVNHQQAPAAG